MPINFPRIFTPLLKKKNVSTRQLDRIEQRLGILENLAHGGRATYVGNNRVLTKVVTDGHNYAYLVEANDLLLAPWLIVTGEYETALTKYFLANIKPNSHCLDLGSNFGFFACLFSRLAAKGRVIAVEADQHVYELCRDNLMINGLQLVGKAMHAAVTDEGQAVTLHRRIGRSGNTSIIVADRSLTDWHGELPAQPFTVRGIRVDDLLDELDGRVDFIKIDVEGAEQFAFRGARSTITRNPQLKIVMEWSPGQMKSAGGNPIELLDELSNLELHFFDIDTRSRLSKHEVLNIDFLHGLLIARAA